MTRPLASEIQAFLEDRGPATATEIALGVRSRHRNIVEALAGFPRVSPPVGANPRSAHYGPSQAVPQAESGTDETGAHRELVRETRRRFRAWKALGESESSTPIPLRDSDSPSVYGTEAA